MSSSEADRVAANQAAFRDANERIRASAKRMQFDCEQRVPFICECGEADCTETVMLSLSAYADLRSDPRRFVLSINHDGETPYETVVADHREQGYLVVEKLGRAGDSADRHAR